MTDLETWARSLFKEHSEPAMTGGNRSTVSAAGPVPSPSVADDPTSLAGVEGDADRHPIPIGAPRGVEEDGANVVPSPANSNFGIVPVIGWIE